MKRIIAVFFSILFCLPLNAVYANEFSIIVDNRTAKPGENVTINVSLENNSGIIAALFNMEYDRERLQLINIQDGQLLEGGTFSKDFESYPYKMLWNSASSNNFINNGTLAVLTFKILDNAPEGQAYINLSYEQKNVYDVNLNDVTINVINGSITVEHSKKSNGISSGGHLSSNISDNNKMNSGDLSKKQIILTIGDKNAIVYGEKILNDVAPIIRNNRTMLPVRFVAEALGAKVEWIGEYRTVKITAEDIEISLVIGQNYAVVNDRKVELDVSSFVEKDRTYLPIRFVSENLGSNVEWDESTKKVTITK